MKKTNWWPLILAGGALYLLSRKSGSGALSGLNGDTKNDDLAFAAANLVSLEEHLLLTYNETKDPALLDQLEQTRAMRRDAMKKLGCGGAGQSWCQQKHLLAAMMRLNESGAKLQAEGDAEGAQDCFDNASKCYTMLQAGLQTNGKPCPCEAV